MCPHSRTYTSLLLKKKRIKPNISTYISILPYQLPTPSHPNHIFKSATGCPNLDLDSFKMINYLVCMVLPIRKAHVIREMLSFRVQNLFVNVKITYCCTVHLTYTSSFNVLKNEKTAFAVFRRNFSMTI